MIEQREVGEDTGWEGKKMEMEGVGVGQQVVFTDEQSCGQVG